MRILQQLLLLSTLLCATTQFARAETPDNVADGKAIVMLHGRAEVSITPDVELFADMLMQQPGLSCQSRNAMGRLLRVAHDEQMRQKVWKRMQRQELLWESNSVLSQIERSAALCNVRLVP